MDAKQVFFPVLKGITAKAVVKNIVDSMNRIEEANNASGNDPEDEDYTVLRRPFPPKRGRANAVLQEVTHLQLQDFINRRAQHEHDTQDKDDDQYFCKIGELEAYELYELGYMRRKEYEYAKLLAR